MHSRETQSIAAVHKNTRQGYGNILALDAALRTEFGLEHIGSGEEWLSTAFDLTFEEALDGEEVYIDRYTEDTILDYGFTVDEYLAFAAGPLFSGTIGYHLDPRKDTRKVKGTASTHRSNPEFEMAFTFTFHEPVTVWDIAHCLGEMFLGLDLCYSVEGDVW